MPHLPEQKDFIDAKEPEDLIVSTDLEDEEMFEAISLELANKNARRILREVVSGYNTSSLIAERTGLTIQDVINHLGKLEHFGLIESDGIDASSLRGRSAKRYRISKVAVLLIPSQPEDEPRLREQLKRKSIALLRKRMLMSIAAGLVWGGTLFSLLLGTEVQHVRSSAPPQGNITVIPQTTYEIISHLSPETWVIMFAVTLASSVGVFFVSRLFSRRVIH
ncbi:MAG TPA: winged helix-turn-helix domain-containing protein [Nitrososphaerales archaeon]|nr:winged helix-turn-helix domain-containing protein [Nitrososphaerales archaeon]